MECLMFQSNLGHHQHAYLRSVKDKVPASSIMSNVGLRRWPSCISTLGISVGWEKGVVASKPGILFQLEKLTGETPFWESTTHL